MSEGQLLTSVESRSHGDLTKANPFPWVRFPFVSAVFDWSLFAARQKQQQQQEEKQKQKQANKRTIKQTKTRNLHCRDFETDGMLSR